MTIEELVLARDRRGMARLRPHLPGDFCRQAAQALVPVIQALPPRPVVVVTGFLVAGRPETDGPPGALAVHRALRRLGVPSVMLSDGPSAEVLAARLGVCPLPVAAMEGPRLPQVITFPVMAEGPSRQAARRLLATLQPLALVAIERCGPGEDGVHRNCRGLDISAGTARLETLFEPALLDELPQRPVTIGVGDGGNEIGMGSLAQACRDEGVHAWPATTVVDLPIIAAVSNWGAWGLLAALARILGLDLLPGEQEFSEELRELVALHCVDGFAAVPQPTVDGFGLDENLEVLRCLRELAQFPGDNP